MVLLSTTSPVSSWSWQNIQDIYAVLGRQLEDYRQLKKRFSIPRTVDINFPDDKNTLILHFWRDVTKINQQIVVLDAEIKRRNNLLGVMG